MTGELLRRSISALAGLAALTCGCTGAPTIAGASDYFKGRTIRLVVGLTPGGGYDAYARLVAQHFGRHIPGNPTVLVQNMPGAGSLNAVKFLDSVAPKDGTAVVVFNAGLITQSVLLPKKVNIDFRNYAWLGSVSEDVRVCFVWHTLNAKTLDDLKGKKELVFGATSPGTLGYIEAQILNRYLGVPLRLVPGYPGSAEKRLAVESGELHGDCGGWIALPSNWVEERKIAPLVRFSQTLLKGMDESVPYVGNVVKEPLRLKALELMLAAEDIGRPFIASKSVPGERIEVLQKAFRDVLRDPALKAEAERQKLTLSPMSGEQVQARLARLYGSEKEVVAEARRTAGTE